MLAAINREHRPIDMLTSPGAQEDNGAHNILRLPKTSVGSLPGHTLHTSRKGNKPAGHLTREKPGCNRIEQDTAGAEFGRQVLGQVLYPTISPKNSLPPCTVQSPYRRGHKPKPQPSKQHTHTSHVRQLRQYANPQHSLP